MSNPLKDLLNFYSECVEEQDVKGYSDLFKFGADLFFDNVKKEGYTPVDIEFLDGYFIFGSGTNSVVHFHIKECKDWKFAIWWNIDPEKHMLVGEFFGQYEPTLDKFKPSRSSFNNNIKIFLTEDNKNFATDGGCERYNYYIEYNIYRAFNFINKHPLRAWAYDYCGYDGTYYYASGLKILRDFIKYKIYTFKTGKILPIFDKNMAKLTLKFGKKIISLDMNEDEYELVLHDSGEYTSPRYGLQCRVPEDYELEGLYGLFGSSEFEQECKKKWERRERFFDFIASKILRVFWFNEACADVVFWKASHWDDEGNYIGPEDNEEDKENDEGSKENPQNM